VRAMRPVGWLVGAALLIDSGRWPPLIICGLSFQATPTLPICLSWGKGFPIVTSLPFWGQLLLQMTRSHSDPIPYIISDTRTSHRQLDIEEVYNSSIKSRRYDLHSMFCYYGQHYHAFIRKDEVRMYGGHRWSSSDGLNCRFPIILSS